MSQDGYSEVERIIADVLRLDAEALSDDDVFEENIPTGSLDYFEIVKLIGMELGILIPNEDLEVFETVGDVKTYVVDRS